MGKQTCFKQGDVVVHARRPEWGDGVVDQATAMTHNGRAAQRLVVRFANRGRVTLNTAVAVIQSKGSEEFMTRTSTSTFSSHATGQGWLGSLKQDNPQELWSLPESMTDPFASLRQRLLATLESYRFSDEARSLIDWAVAQSGLADPLSKYNRHELEQAFARYARDRDRHLVELARSAKRQEQHQLLNQLVKQVGQPAAQCAAQRAIKRL